MFLWCGALYVNNHFSLNDSGLPLPLTGLVYVSGQRRLTGSPGKADRDNESAAAIASLCEMVARAEGDPIFLTRYKTITYCYDSRSPASR